MNNQNLIIGGLVLTVLFLLKKKPVADLQTVTLKNNATLQNDDLDANYQAIIYSGTPIQATVNKRCDNRFDVTIKSKTYDDMMVNPPAVDKIPMLC
jgi:hypothetical protein